MIKLNEKKEDIIIKMLKTGLHFGHLKSKWHPKMAPYIFDTRNNIHIIDLEQTLEKLQAALDFIKETVRKKEQVVFVGTKKQAKSPVRSVASKCGMPYVVERWLGGTLTNFDQINQRLKYLDDLEAKYNSGQFAKYTKKEQLEISREIARLNQKMGGIRSMKKMPGAIFVVGVDEDKLAIKEAKATGIPVVGIIDTNNDPRLADYPIPANDDANSSIGYICEAVAEVVLEAKGEVENEKIPNK